MIGQSGASVWQITRGRRIAPAPFFVAGIVNITPDSFSDGGAFFSPEAALDRIVQVAEEGGHMADLGAESTRSGSADVGHEEEMRRLSPPLRAAADMRSRGKLPGEFLLSVDTWRADTARCCLEMGADVVNDVSGGCFDPAMAEVLGQYKSGYVLGHSPDKPRTMQVKPYYDDVVQTLLAFFEERMAHFVKAGLPEECIVLDPCVGFGKNLEHNLAVMRAAPKFLTLGRPLYYGISRKSFLGELTGLPVDQRGEATQAATAVLAGLGVAVHRVHEVAATVRTLNIVKSLCG